MYLLHDIRITDHETRRELEFLSTLYFKKIKIPKNVNEYACVDSYLWLYTTVAVMQFLTSIFSLDDWCLPSSLIRASTLLLETNQKV